MATKEQVAQLEADLAAGRSISVGKPTVMGQPVVRRQRNVSSTEMLATQARVQQTIGALTPKITEPVPITPPPGFGASGYPSGGSLGGGMVYGGYAGGTVPSYSYMLSSGAPPGAPGFTSGLPSTGGSPCAWNDLNCWLSYGAGQAAGWLTGQLGIGQTEAKAENLAAGPCPTGYEYNAGTGQCDAVGTMGAIQRFLPGGATGVMQTGQAVMGQYGVALTPTVVGQIQNKLGQTNPVLRCIPGMVLGKDNLCYNKADLRKRERKWPPGTPPMLTGGEVRTLTRARALEKKVRRAWERAGKPGPG